MKHLAGNYTRHVMQAFVASTIRHKHVLTFTTLLANPLVVLVTCNIKQIMFWVDLVFINCQSSQWRTFTLNRLLWIAACFESLTLNTHTLNRLLWIACFEYAYFESLVLNRLPWIAYFVRLICQGMSQSGPGIFKSDLCVLAVQGMVTKPYCPCMSVEGMVITPYCSCLA